MENCYYKRQWTNFPLSSFVIQVKMNRYLKGKKNKEGFPTQRPCTCQGCLAGHSWSLHLDKTYERRVVRDVLCTWDGKWSITFLWWCVYIISAVYKYSVIEMTGWVAETELGYLKCVYSACVFVLHSGWISCACVCVSVWVTGCLAAVMLGSLPS